MLATELEICCAVFPKRMHKPSENSAIGMGCSSPPQKKMRVEYTVPSSEFTWFIPPGTNPSPPTPACTKLSPKGEWPRLLRTGD